MLERIRTIGGRGIVSLDLESSIADVVLGRPVTCDVVVALVRPSLFFGGNKCYKAVCSIRNVGDYLGAATIERTSLGTSASVPVRHCIDLLLSALLYIRGTPMKYI